MNGYLLLVDLDLLSVDLDLLLRYLALLYLHPVDVLDVHLLVSVNLLVTNLLKLLAKVNGLSDLLIGFVLSISFTTNNNSKEVVVTWIKSC